MSDEDDTLLAEIIELATQFSEASSVSQHSRLYADLGLTGDDARAFIETFAAKYDVDMSAFVWLRYFEDEGSDMMGPALALAASVLSPQFAVRWQAARDAEREITIAHLVDLARARVWRDPDGAFKRVRGPIVLTLIFSTLSVFVAAFFTLGSGAVLYALLAGGLGQKSLVVTLGVIATGLVFPALAYASWRKIRRKLASADQS